MKTIYEKYKHSNKCPSCGRQKPRSYTKVLCGTCCSKKKAIYDQRSASGLCVGCGKAQPLAGIKFCENCKRLNSVASKKAIARRKQKVILAYGGKCVCCGESNPDFLTIDHILNDGAEERKKFNGYNGQSTYSALIKSGFPKDRYQLLCWNCNMGKRINNGICPHLGCAD